MRKQFGISLLIAQLALTPTMQGCGRANIPGEVVVPAREYSETVRTGTTSARESNQHERMRLHQMESEKSATYGRSGDRQAQLQDQAPGGARAALQPGALNVAYGGADPRASAQLFPDGPTGLNPSDYNGPLSLGDPGVSASLWRESSMEGDFFRDTRAWRPMDLLTIIISEESEGKKEADTEVKQDSSVLAKIENLIGIEDTVTRTNPQVNLDSLISASTQNNYKGEGETNRKDSLVGTISAMVAEVLPSGILRIEGSKIIAVNNEEQIMVLSGLVRPRDITSDNSVQSSRIANMRIDYYGKGSLEDAQHEGWLSRVMRKVWPF